MIQISRSRSLVMRVITLLTLFLVLACTSVRARAAGSAGVPPVPPGGDWAVSAGAGLVATPEYPGSRSMKVIPIPSWNIVYKNRYFSRGLDLAGAYLVNDNAWSAGGSLTCAFAGREQKDDPRLSGTDDVGGTVRANLFATRKVSLFSLSLRASQDVGGNGQGFLAGADASLTIPFVPRWFFSAGPGVTWADRRYSEKFFGVSAEAAARSGLPRHDAKSGLVDGHLKVVSRYALTESWGASAIVTVSRIVGSAAESPITESRNQASGIFSATYRFLP